MSELDKYAITAWVPTDGDLNGKQVTQKVIHLDIANSVVKNLLLEAKLDTLNKANEFYKSEPDIIGDYFKGAIGGIKAQLGVSK